MDIKNKIGSGVRMKDGTPGVLIGVGELITVDLGSRKATFVPDAFENGFLSFDDSAHIEKPAEPTPDPYVIGNCEKCGCALTKGDEYCPCCGEINPGADWVDCPNCGECYAIELKCPNCGERNPATLNMDDEEYEYQLELEEESLRNEAFEEAEEGSPVTDLRCCVFPGDAIEPQRFEWNEELETAVIPNGVRLIGHDAFRGCRFLSHLALPHGLERIGADAFAGCGMSEVEVPETVVYVGEGAFRDCAELESAVVHCPRSAVAPNAFDGCQRLREVEYLNND